MSKMKKERKVYQEVVVDKENGEVITHKTVYQQKEEPDFIKLYIDCMLKFKGLKQGLNPILMSFLQYMSYADINGIEGGQIIFVNHHMKKIIADSLGVTVKRIEQALTQFVKSGVFRRVAVGTYQVNPNIFGRGDWKNINNIRATFDFGVGEIVADIVKNEEQSMTENQQALEDEFQTSMFDNQSEAV